jgi:hypothetical protein
VSFFLLNARQAMPDTFSKQRQPKQTRQLKWKIEISLGGVHPSIHLTSAADKSEIVRETAKRVQDGGGEGR